MTAHEQEPQHIVTVMRAVEALGQGGFGILEIGEALLGRQGSLSRAKAHAIERRIAADEDEPGRGIARRPVPGPGIERLEASVLKGLLSRVEIAEIAKQGAERLRPRRRQRRLDPGKLGHAAVTRRSSAL